MGGLWEMELGSAPKASVSAAPYVHGGAGSMTSCGCLRHTRKKIRQSGGEDGEVVKESIFSSNTPEERVWEGREGERGVEGGREGVERGREG